MLCIIRQLYMTCPGRSTMQKHVAPRTSDTCRTWRLSKCQGLSTQVLQHVSTRALLPPGPHQNSTYRNAMSWRQDRSAELDVDQELPLYGVLLQVTSRPHTLCNISYAPVKQVEMRITWTRFIRDSPISADMSVINKQEAQMSYRGRVRLCIIQKCYT